MNVRKFWGMGVIKLGALALAMSLAACGEDGKNGVDGASGEPGLAGEKGDNGKSVYELAVAAGFKGTEEEWFASLKGSDGKGGNGKSAYELAVAAGFKGTEEEWLASLKGSDIKGEDGENGVGCEVSSKDGKVFITCNTSQVVIDPSDPTKVSNFFKDVRDGQMYRMVEICNEQKENCQTWMAQNLNYSVKPGEQSWCGGGESETQNEGDCSVYGRLYLWEAAMDIEGCAKVDCKNIYESTQGICPDGWHVPSDAEWNTLFENVGGIDIAGRKLKARNALGLWDLKGSLPNDDSFDFSVLPGGFRSLSEEFSSTGEGVYFMSSTEVREGQRTCVYVFSHKKDEAELSRLTKFGLGYAVRCIKDAE